MNTCMTGPFVVPPERRANRTLSRNRVLSDQPGAIEAACQREGVHPLTEKWPSWVWKHMLDQFRIHRTNAD